MSVWGLDPLGSDQIPEAVTTLDVTHDRTYAEKAPERLIEQYREKPILTAILRSLMAWCQRLEDASWEVIVFRRIDRAEGVTLDKLGSIVRRPRQGLSDRDYRIAIRAQVKILRSKGRPEDLIAIMTLSCPAGTVLRYREEGPAGFRFEINSRVQFEPAVPWVGLRLAKAAGVRVGLMYSRDPSSGWLELGDSLSPSSSPQGLGDALTPGTGGTLRTIRSIAP